jgi:zinc protease
MIRPKILGMKLCLIALGVATLAAAGTAFQAASSDQVSIPCTHYKLKNGLQVILAEDYSLPVVSVVVTYRIGSAGDPPGRAGLAYLLENLMFLGSADVSQMQHIGFINRVGGRLSASVDEDRTVFYQTVPSNHLALVLWLESDRMKSLQWSAAKVESSKMSLIEEARQRALQDPYAMAAAAFDRLLYPGYALSHSTFGQESDLRSVTTDEAVDFYSTFYVPNNAILCVSGNINKVKTRELISRYFESIPRGRDVPSPPPAPSFARTSVRETFREPRAPVPGFLLGFRITSPNPEDRYVLTLLDFILSQGRSSRFNKRLWQKERLVLQMSGGLEHRGPFMAYRLFATNNNEVMVDRSLDAIFGELQKFKSSFISDSELAKARNIFKMTYFNRLATTLDKALFLSDAMITLRNFDDFPNELGRYLNVTPQLLVGLANRYFTKENAVITSITTR